MSDTEVVFESDKEDLKKVIKFFWGESIANQAPLSESTFQFVSNALQESGECSDMMDLVPRPTNPIAKPGIGYAVKQIRRIAKELVAGNEKQYITCKNWVALRYKSGILELVNGI